VTDAPLNMASGASIYPSLYIEVCKVLFSTKPFFCGVSPGLLHASSMSGRKRSIAGLLHKRGHCPNARYCAVIASSYVVLKRHVVVVVIRMEIDYRSFTQVWMSSMI
jgi:hypothetical protein